MATKSITKDVRIKNSALCRSFVNALEQSEKKGSISVTYSRKVREIKDPDTIRSIFDE